MSETELNPLNIKQRRLLQYGVVFILVVFLAVYFAVVMRKQPQGPKNTSVYIENSQLQVFDDKYSLEAYPDKVLMHYPYLLVIQASKQKTVIYNLETKSKEMETNQLLLDYDGKNSLYNSGKDTFLNKEDLSVFCDIGFIKSPSEVLCVTKVDPNFAENKLVSINVTTKKQKDVHVHKNLITAISIINDSNYIGVSDLYTHKNYLVVDEKRLEFPDVISFIYQMNSKAYVGSLKSAFNNNMEGYYQIMGAENVKKEGGMIYLVR